MRIYTRTGDAGTTGIIGGSRVTKDDAIIQSVGALDEANASIGLVRAQGVSDFDAILASIQSNLFSLGAEVATPLGKAAASVISDEATQTLEQDIDRLTAELLPLRAFILPGGSQVGAALHHARTVVRRAESQLIALSRQKPIQTESLAYMNRLSDWLFTAARYANHKHGVPDVEWHSPTP